MDVTGRLLIPANAKRWENMVLDASRGDAFDRAAKRLIASKERYEEISAATKVPWYVIAVVHEREASGNFGRQLAQGDPLSARSTHVPVGLGPFVNHGGHDAFYWGAVGGLQAPPGLVNWPDWSIGGILTALEEFNGEGYAKKGVPSAYVWSGSNQYISGKYVADHVYRASAVDVQEGCAPLLACMMELIDFNPPAPIVLTNDTEWVKIARWLHL